MKKIIVFVLSLFVFIFPGEVRAQETEHIQSFDTDITVSKDGTITVKENIEYFFDSPKHGIFRNIPVVKTNDSGKKYEMSLSGISVTDEKGGGYLFTQSRNGTDEVLKIGDANTTITGTHWYVISYTVSGALTYFSGHDELYWNAVGTGWPVPITSAVTTVTLPQPVAAADFQTKCDICAISLTGASAVFTVTRPLNPNEGLTFVAGFPKGIVAVLEPGEVVPFFSTAAGKIALVLLGLAVFLWYLVAPFLVINNWWKYGRDPKPAMGEVSAWFSPPKTRKLRDLTPAETGALVDETVDLKDIYGSLVDLARRGYMKIIETKKNTYDFEKRKDWVKDKTIRPFEDTLLSAIFLDKDRVSIKNLELSATFGTVKTQIYDSLVVEGFFPENPQKVRRIYYVLAGFAFVTGNFILSLVSFLFGKNMPRKTLYGAEQAAVAGSLKNFLVSQDKQLTFQASKQMMFEKLLPYAIAFGVEEIWAKRFADLGLKQPAWYVSPTGRAFNTMIFAHSIGHAAVMSFAQSVTTRSSTGFSSGFSGGGFSGGGGGGGGGGSW